MDNKISKTGPDGADSIENKRINPKSMSDKRGGNPGGSCRKRSHTSAGISATLYIGKQTGAVYERDNITKAANGIQRIK